MKVLIIFFLLFTLGLASAAPRWMPLTVPNKRGRVPSKFPLITGTPRVLAGGEPQNEITAVKQVFPLLAPAALYAAPALGSLGASLGKEIVKHVVCDPDSQLQEYAGNEERDAKIMALVKVMSNMLAAQEKLKKLNVEDNLVAKTELFDSISDALGGALDIVGGVTKGVLCNEY